MSSSLFGSLPVSGAPVRLTKELDAFVEPPNLGDDKEVEVDFETTGVRWWAGDRPGGVGVHRADGATFYVAWGHHGGGNNISEEAGLRWFKDAMRNRRITNLSTAFEVHMAREWGADLEELGCEVSDVAHWAALIDDHRRRFSLEALCLDYLPESERKVTAVDGVKLDMSRAMDYPASVMAVRAMADVRQVGLLKKVLWPILDSMDLQRVRALEDQVIYAACEMEKNAARIDVEKLERWVVETAEELDHVRREVAKELGHVLQENLFGGPPAESGFLNPDSNKEMEALFKKLDLPISRTEPTKAHPDGQPSFTTEILSAIEHPLIKKISRQAKLTDIRSKYLVPWQRAVRRDGGLLRFRLHQCRNDKHGTVRGRFSSSLDEGGYTPHQVMKPSKQRKAMGDKYILRELIVPEQNHVLISADAMQIEYRIFASYTGSKALREAYAADPYLKFHEHTRGMIAKVKADLDYDSAKTMNFLTIYGGGLPKLALQLKFITTAQFIQLYKEYPMEPKIGKFGPPSDHPLLARALEVKQIYNRVLPEVAPLSKRARDLAKDRGYVVDVLGRRANFPNGFGAHGALNAIIQPSAAEVMKLKMVEIHRERRKLGLKPRITVHDEWVGSCPRKDSADALREILNRQSFPEFEKIPILWDVKAGKNWASCTSELESEFEDMGADGLWGGKKHHD